MKGEENVIVNEIYVVCILQLVFFLWRRDQ